MGQFTLYKNENQTSNTVYPFFIDIQHELLADLNTRVVIPLSPFEMVDENLERLTPVIQLNQTDYVLMTHLLTSISKKQLSESVISVEGYRNVILSAVDMLVSGI
jgi:toxin CcdB